MADEDKEIEDLVRRSISEALRRGGMQELLAALRTLEAYDLVSSQRVTPGGAVLKLTGGTPDVRVEPAPAGKGTLSGEAHAVVTPVIKAEGIVIPAEAVDEIRKATPGLAAEIEKRPERTTAIINNFEAWIRLLIALIGIYLAQHPASLVTPEHITQLFDQSQHITVNQTTIINPPPPPPAPGPSH